MTAAVSVPETWSVPIVDPEHVIFFSGAGISADAPSNGPIGLDLTRRALRYAFLEEAFDELRETYTAVFPPAESRAMPRLEAVLEIAVQVHGSEVLETLLADLAEAEPNPLHRFFGEHMRRGGHHVTANFDTLIERYAPDVRPLHFHGALGGDPGSYERLGARLSKLERGFDREMRERMRGALLGFADPTIVVVGYSGLDFFDVDPFFVAVADELRASNASVLWVAHDHEAPPGRLAISHPDARRPPLVRLLERAGVRVTTVTRLTASVLDDFARQWRMPLLRPQGGGARMRSLRPLPQPLRVEATRRLYLHMGMFRAHERLVDQFPFANPQVDAAARGELAWQKGQYRRALANWNQLYEGDDGAVAARRWERRAAVLWVRGSYLRAYAASCRSVRLAHRSGDVEALSVALETQSRILVHAARAPDLRWFATNARRHRLSASVDEVMRQTRFGTHIDVRLRDARALLANDPERDGGSSRVSQERVDGVESFNQYESLSAVLDFRRGIKRARVAAGLELMDREWLNAFRRAAEVLGKEASIRSLPTLPGAAEHYSLAEGLWMLLRAPATVWHRLRLAARFLIARRSQARSGRSLRLYNEK